MYFNPIISTDIICLLIAATVCVTLTTLIYLLRVRSVAVYQKRNEHNRADKADEAYQPASIIVYSQSDAENLQQLLSSLLNQDYPTDYEVIVVNEGDSADVKDVVNLLRQHHSNLYLTFTPEGVVNLSRKKLALTLGVKAARHPIVIQTTTAACIESSLWLRSMMYSFGADSPIEVVLGYSYAAPDEDHEFGARQRAFDAVADAVRWLGVAIVGKPFRGTEYNLAYSKDLFMRNKGFARSFNLHYGDDDIFVSEIANRKNTAVELSEASMVRLRSGNHPRIFSERVLRRKFTERFIRRRPRILFQLGGWLQIAALIMATVAVWIDWQNIFTISLAALIPILLIILDIVIWRKVMIVLKGRPLLLSLPWFAMTYPFRKLGLRMRSRLSKVKKYTWD